jgi:hypothetical protein
MLLLLLRRLLLLRKGPWKVSEKGMREPMIGKDGRKGETTTSVIGALRFSVEGGDMCFDQKCAKKLSQKCLVCHGLPRRASCAFFSRYQ